MIGFTFVYRAIRTRFVMVGSALLLTSVHAAAGYDGLLLAAKNEGEVVWYTTQIVDQIARPIADAFQKKYGIKVNFVRSDSNTVVLQIVNE